MGINGKDTRIVELVNDTLHIYVDIRGYVRMHFYTSSQMDADCIAKCIGGSVSRHKDIFDVKVYKRSTLRAAAVRLSALPEISERLKSQLKLVIAYCDAESRLLRVDTAVVLRACLT